jgi:hypothetical protein
MHEADKFVIKLGAVMIVAIACTVVSYRKGSLDTEKAAIAESVLYGQREYDRGIRDGKRSWPSSLYVRVYPCEKGKARVEVCPVEGVQDCFSYYSDAPCKGAPE